MKNRLLLRVSLTLLAFFLAGCRAAPLYNPRVSFTPRDPATVEPAILKALANRGWLAQEEGPGVIVGTLNIRSHQAIVRIEYTESSYSIRYQDSQDLLYERKADGSEMIHRNYNGWITNLVHDINSTLAVPSQG